MSLYACLPKSRACREYDSEHASRRFLLSRPIVLDTVRNWLGHRLGSPHYPRGLRGARRDDNHACGRRIFRCSRVVSDRLGRGVGDAAERHRGRGRAGGLEGPPFCPTRGIDSLRRRFGGVRRRHKRGRVRYRPRASGAQRRPPHCPALRPRRSSCFPPSPSLVLCVFLVGVGSPLAGRPRDRRPRDPGVGLALRLRRRSALRCGRGAPHRLRPALNPDCTRPALPRARVPLARRRACRNWRHAAPACGRPVLALRAVRGLRPRRVHHCLGAAPTPAERNVHVPPRHALGDPCEVERTGLTGRSRRHDPAHPPARARLVRGILRLVGHPRVDHMVDWRGRPGTRSRCTPAPPAPGHRRNTHGDRSDPRRSDPVPLDPRVGGPHRLAARRPRSRSRSRSPVRHGTRGHPRGQARARGLLAAGRRFGGPCPRTRPRVRRHERVGRHRHGGRGGLRSLLGDCCCACDPHRGRGDAAASLIGTRHG